MTKLAELVAEGLRRHPEAAAIAASRPETALDLMGETGRQIREQGWETDAFVLMRHAKGMFEHSPPKTTLVLTMPPKIAAAMNKVAKITYRTTRGSITELIAGAQEEVLLMAPYCHPDLVTDLAAPLSKALAGGARVSLVLRADGSWDNAPFVHRLRREVHGAIDVCEIEEDDHLSHAKVVIADSRQAYIGSGNLTPHGYGRNLEAGVLVEGDVATSLRRCIAEYTRMVRSRGVA